MADTKAFKDSIVEERRDRKKKEKDSYWKTVLSHYEKRNASLERRQAALKERVRFMECTLPSLLMGAVVGTNCPSDSRNRSHIPRK